MNTIYQYRNFYFIAIRLTHGYSNCNSVCAPRSKVIRSFESSTNFTFKQFIRHTTFSFIITKVF